MTKKLFLLAVGFVLLTASSAQAALTAGATYSVVLAKVNSNGTTTDITSTTSVADSNGKIGFTFSSIPTNSDANFLVVTVKGPTKNAVGTATPDTASTVVNQSLAPAPAAGVTNSAGVNSLSYAQSRAMLIGFQAAGSDDPIFASFGFVILRAPGLSDADILRVATGARSAILGSNGFVGFLSDNGVTSTQLATFRQKLIYNSGFRSLPDFAAKFKDAVDHSVTSAATATEDMAQAGGFMGDIFIDAASAAGIDLSLIVAAFKASGGVADSDPNLAALPTNVTGAMGQAINNFFTRISTSRVKREYSAALTLLGASGSQVDRFNTAVDNMVTTMQSLEATYGKYFEDPDHNTLTAAIQAEMNTAFQSAFNTFQGAILSTDAEISTLKTSMATQLGISVATLSGISYGTYRDSDGTSKNWPIPQTVLHQWLVTNVLATGGSLTYTRDTLAIPATMNWLPARTDFSALPTSLASLQGLEEDLRIIEMTKFALFRTGVPTRAQEQAAELLFQQRIVARQTALGGTTNGTTAVSADQKKAIVRLMIQPNIH